MQAFAVVHQLRGPSDGAWTVSTPYEIWHTIAFLDVIHSRISTPRTKYSTNPIDTVPLHGLNLIKEVIAEAFPELAEIGFTESRVLTAFLPSRRSRTMRLTTAD